MRVMLIYHRHKPIEINVVKFLSWSLALREEDRLVVFENRVLRTIFGPKRDEMTGE
jgi:hypothetical protein